MSAASLWAVASAQRLALTGEPLFTKKVREFLFTIRSQADSLWIEVCWLSGAKAAFRVAYSPDPLRITETEAQPEKIAINLESLLGRYRVSVMFPEGENAMIHYTLAFTPAQDVSIPFWPRDIIITDKDGNIENSEGDVYIRQMGIRSGMLYAGDRTYRSGTFLYLHNLTSLNPYCQETETSLAGAVGGGVAGTRLCIACQQR